MRGLHHLHVWLKITKSPCQSKDLPPDKWLTQPSNKQQQGDLMRRKINYNQVVPNKLMPCFTWWRGWLQHQNKAGHQLNWNHELALGSRLTAVLSRAVVVAPTISASLGASPWHQGFTLRDDREPLELSVKLACHLANRGQAITVNGWWIRGQGLVPWFGEVNVMLNKLVNSRADVCLMVNVWLTNWWIGRSMMLIIVVSMPWMLDLCAE